MDRSHHRSAGLMTAASAAGCLVNLAITTAAAGQFCAAGSGASITAGPAVAPGQPLQAAFTVSAPDGDGCSVLIDSVRVWLPTNLPETPDCCEATNGLELPVSGLILGAGEFLRFTGFDSPMPNCLEQLDVNCEMILPEMTYLADPADTLAGGLLFFGCWEGTALPGGEPVQVALDDFALLVQPQLSVSLSSDVTQVCAASPTNVTFTCLVSTGTSDVPIEDVSVVDQTGGNAARGADAPGNNDGVLEPGEVWSFMSVLEVQGEFTCEMTASGQDAAAMTPLLVTASFTLQPSCPADLVCDGSVGTADLAVLLSAWGAGAKHPADLDSDQQVGSGDLAVLLSQWGSCG